VALVEYLLPLVSQAPLLWLLLYRPEQESGAWRLREKAARDHAGRFVDVPLRRLDPDDCQELLAHLVRLDPWPPEMQELILSRTEGNPLYIEELLRVLVDDGVLVRDGSGWQVSGSLEALKVPDTLEGVMMTRLDRLGETYRHTTQVASVVGRMFPFDTLEHVLPAESQDTLNPCLKRLQQQEIAREAQRAPELVYMFRHGMMQEVCYGSLLARTRRQYHRSIAEYLEAHHGESEENLALVAHHAFAGQDWPRALHYQRLAGQQARKLFANHEAIDHFTKALHSAENLPEVETTSERQTLYAALGELLTTTGQYDRAQECLNQARELAASLGDVDAQARACRWRARLHELRSEYPPAFEWIEHGLAVLAGRETAEAAELRLIAGLIHSRQGENERALSQCQAALRIAESLGEVTVLARANNLLGHLNRLRGNPVAALSYLQRAFDLYQQAGDINGQALTHNLTAIVYMYLSQWPQAEHHYRQARDIFHRVGDLYNRAFADNNLGEILLKRGQLDEALTFYGEALRAFEQIGGSAYVLGALHNNLSAVYVRQGQAAPAREHLSTSQRYFEQAKARDFLPEMHRHFAEAALLAGELAEAEAHAQQALSLALELSLRSEEGNSLRVLGEIALAQGQPAQAEEHLRASRGVLDEVGEVYEGARTALVLARLHLAQGERDKAAAAIGQSLPVFERLEAALDLAEARELRDRLTRV
jgi:tetratricopeptide (TPR) repeat protein